MSYLGVPIPFRTEHKIFYLLKRIHLGPGFSKGDLELIHGWLPPNPYDPASEKAHGFNRGMKASYAHQNNL